MSAGRDMREARGQTLVFFVVLMGGLVLLLALVLNVGAVATAQRQMQSLADGAALAGVQQLPFDEGAAVNAADSYGNAPSATLVTAFPDGATISVHASRPVSGLLLPLVSTPTAKATASARIEPAQALDNAQLGKATRSNSPYLVPLVVNERRACGETSCFGLAGARSLSFRDGDFDFICPESSACMSGVHGSRGRQTLVQWMTCGPRCGLQRTYGRSAPGVISDPDVAAPGAFNGGQMRSALLGLRDAKQTLIVPLYSSDDGRDVTLSGFGAFVITDVPSWSSDKTIVGYFITYTTPGHLSYPPVSSPDAWSYGVRTIGLTQ